jgi:hypothetical protein
MGDTPNPYRFTVIIAPNDNRTRWYVEVYWTHLDADDAFICDSGAFDSLAEANEHAELIRQAMREVQ